ncbi:MAG: sugar phosphate nucleotidyltransferase [Bacteroidota bacterium]
MKAMIFSAGLGTRFKPWTDHHPKALAPVHGKSLLQRNVEYLQAYNIKEVVVNVHHFADQIEIAIEQAQGWGSYIQISDERNDVLETGGGLLKAESLLRNQDPFLTCNVDILTDLDISELLEFHRSHKPLISFGVSDRPSGRQFLFNRSYQLCGWKNNTTGEVRMSRNETEWMPRSYSCVAIFEPIVFDLMRSYGFSGKFSLTDVYLRLATEHTILGYDHSGDRFIDVGKPEAVKTAEELFN